MSERKSARGIFKRLVACGAWLALAFSASQASASMLVVEESGLITGSQTVVRPFDLPGAGTLQITLTDLGWPARLQTLSFALSDATQVLSTLAAPGTQTYTVTGPAGQLFAHVYGRASGSLDSGLYSLRVQFTPVPLPTAAVLMLTGLGMLAAMRKRREPLLPATA